ncbi:methyltransferase family protein [Salinimicrobium xinjiangense]|uniref:methyltransferase family protein n=1 Tax=Salinimicrobium xinjiangense TaxID=438596 RepID=UPI000402E5E0|nr:isoprenylcysteine carboxylmethyltransferase family protein [Salinimicrobium xinjiangense]
MAVPQKDKIFVGLQFLLFFTWFLEVENWKFELSDNLQSLALITAGIGLILILAAFLQLNTKLSPFPSPKKGAKLITGGVFAFARHPIYSGILFGAFGISFWLGSGYKLLISLMLYILLYFKSRYEEQRLTEVFPEYPLYRKNTGRFFPKFSGRI